MNEFREFKNILSEEQQKREQQQALLESTAGFGRLSLDQKRFLLSSLFIQQRAERGTDEASTSRILEVPKHLEHPTTLGLPYIAHPEEIVDVDPETDNYRQSQLYVMKEYCHRAVRELEQYHKQEDIPEKWVDAGQIQSFNDLMSLIHLAEDQHPAPYVIEIWDTRSRQKFCAHTAVLLGLTTTGEFLVWEKTDYHLPFQLLDLQEVYQRYSKFTGWKLRPLKV